MPRIAASGRAVDFRRSWRGAIRRGCGAGALGGVHRVVGGGEQGGEVVAAVPRAGHAEAGGHRHVGGGVALTPRGDDGFAHRFGAPAGDVGRTVGHQDGELLAAKAPEYVVRAQQHLAGRDRPLERIVAGGMAVHIVDRLEVIQVHHHQAGLARVASAVAQRVLRGFEEMLAVEDAGQAVAPRQLLEFHQRALGAVRPAADDEQAAEQEQDVEQARARRLCFDLLLQEEQLIPDVCRHELALFVEHALVHHLVGQRACADVVQIGLVGRRIFFVIRQCGGSVALLLEDPVEHVIGVGHGLGLVLLVRQFDRALRGLSRVGEVACAQIGLRHRGTKVGGQCG